MFGMGFGPDLSGHTGWEETVYKFRIPVDKPEIVDMDTGNVLLDAAGGSSIALDENSQTIFTGDSGLSPSTIHLLLIN